MEKTKDEYTELELQAIKNYNHASANFQSPKNFKKENLNSEFLSPFGSGRDAFKSHRKSSYSDSPNTSRSPTYKYKNGIIKTPNKSKFVSNSVEAETKNIHHLRNSDKQLLWSNKALNNKHRFSHLQSLDPEINEIQSISQDNWKTAASYMGVYIFYYISANKNVYLKTESHVPDNFYSLASVIFDEYSMKNWNPYQLEMNVENYVKDEYGIYDAQYEIKLNDKKFKICDRWLSLLWQNSSSNFILKYNLINEKSKYQKSSNLRYNSPFEQIQIDKVISDINNPGVFKDSSTVNDIYNKSETCIIKNYQKLADFKFSPDLIKFDEDNIPEFNEVLLRKFIYKKMCCLASVMKNESGQIYNEIFGTNIKIKGIKMSETLNLINEQEMKRIEEDNQNLGNYYDLDYIKKFDTIENDADWNNFETHIQGRRMVMRQNWPEREPLLDKFMEKMKSKFGSRISHISENIFARYVDGWLGDLTIAEQNFVRYIDYQKKRKLFKKYHWEIKPCNDCGLFKYLGKAKDGCSVLLCNIRNNNPAATDADTWCDYFIQLNNYYAMKCQKYDKTYMIVDTYNMGYSNIDMESFKKIGPVVGNLVPDMLKKSFLVRCNWFQDLIYKAGKNFVHPRTVEKITLINGNEEKHGKMLAEYFDLDIQPKNLGGTLENFE